MKRIILVVMISSFTFSSLYLQGMQTPKEIIVKNVSKEALARKRKEVEKASNTITGDSKNVSRRLKKDSRFKVPRIQETPEKIDIENDVNRKAEEQLNSFSSKDNNNLYYSIGAILNTINSPARPLRMANNFLPNFFIEINEINADNEQLLN